MDRQCGGVRLRGPAFSLEVAGLAAYYVALGFLAFYLDAVYVHGPGTPWPLREGIKDSAWILLLPLFVPALLKARMPRLWLANFFLLFSLIIASLVVNPPADGRVILAVLRNNMLYSIVPFAAGIQLARRGYQPSFGSFVKNLALLQAVIAIAQRLFHLTSPYIIATKPDVSSPEDLIAHGGFLSYIELSAFLCLGIVYLVSRRRMGVAAGMQLLILCAGVVLSTARLGLILVGIILFVRFGMRVLAWITLVGALVAALLWSGGNARIVSEGLHTPRYANWLALIQSQPVSLVRLQYGFYGSATSAAGQSGANYADSTVVSGYLQGGILGLAAVLFPFAAVFARELRLRIGRRLYWLLFRRKWIVWEKTGMKNVLLVLVLFSYSVVFNFADGWPGNFLTWSTLGIIVGGYAQRRANTDSHHSDQECRG
jgi:hypothetical protein